MNETIQRTIGFVNDVLNDALGGAASMLLHFGWSRLGHIN